MALYARSVLQDTSLDLAQLSVPFAPLDLPRLKEAPLVPHVLLVPLLLITLAHLVTQELTVLLDPLNVQLVQLDIIQTKEAKPVTIVPLDTINQPLNQMFNVPHALPVTTPLVMQLYAKSVLLDQLQVLQVAAVLNAPLVHMFKIMSAHLVHKELSLIPQTPQLVLSALLDSIQLLEAQTVLSVLLVTL